LNQGTILTILWSVVFICVIATMYPYFLYPVILRTLPARPVMRDAIIPETAIGPETGNDFALLFCAYNEAESLPDKLRNLRDLRQAFPDIEFLAYDDGSSDGTADMIEDAGLGITLVRGSRTGKAHGMKLLVSMTDREFIVFTDANVELDLEALRVLRAVYADKTIGGVCGQLHYVGTEVSAVAEAGGAYWRLEELIKTLESRSGNVMGADGAVFSIRRSLYPSFPDSVLDDLTVSMAVVFQGYRLIKDPLVIGREKLVASRPDDFSRRVRIATRAFHTHLWLKPQIRRMALGDRWRYWSHRYLRWHGAIFVAVGYFCALIALALSSNWIVAMVAAIITIAIFLAGTHSLHGTISSIVHIAASIFITGIGVAKARMGGTMTTWQPPKR
jgi:cellulose synthase/poly-beta-1,6-N-acetylglucosamine synthase-like glycosyltransferase